MDGRWVHLYGSHQGEPKSVLGFWGEGDFGEDSAWFDSEAANHALTAFDWSPTHWAPFTPPSPAPVPSL
jgi:hypothetical protein